MGVRKGEAGSAGIHPEAEAHRRPKRGRRPALLLRVLLLLLLLLSVLREAGMEAVAQPPGHAIISRPRRPGGRTCWRQGSIIRCPHWTSAPYDYGASRCPSAVCGVRHHHSQPSNSNLGPPAQPRCPLPHQALPPNLPPRPIPLDLCPSHPAPVTSTPPSLATNASAWAPLVLGGFGLVWAGIYNPPHTHTHSGTHPVVDGSRCRHPGVHQAAWRGPCDLKVLLTATGRQEAERVGGEEGVWCEVGTGCGHRGTCRHCGQRQACPASAVHGYRYYACMGLQEVTLRQAVPGVTSRPLRGRGHCHETLVVAKPVAAAPRPLRCAALRPQADGVGRHCPTAGRSA